MRIIIDNPPLEIVPRGHAIDWLELFADGAFRAYFYIGLRFVIYLLIRDFCLALAVNIEYIPWVLGVEQTLRC